MSVVFADGVAYVGDAAGNFLHWAGTKYCVISVNDLDTYYKSWRQLIESGAQTIFPGHGAPFPVAKLRENVGRQRKDHIVRFA